MSFPNYKNALEVFEREYFDRLLSHTKGHLTKATEVSGLSKPTISERLKKLGLGHEAYREAKALPAKAEDFSKIALRDRMIETLDQEEEALAKRARLARAKEYASRAKASVALKDFEAERIFLRLAVEAMAL